MSYNILFLFFPIQVSKMSSFARPLLKTLKLTEAQLPPRIRPLLPGYKDDLSPSELKQANQLRQSDPYKWTLSALSKHFKVEPDILHLRVKSTNEHRLAIQRIQNETFDMLSWTRKRRILDRMRKRALW